MLAVPGEAPVLIAAHPARATDTTGAGDAFCGAFMSRWLATPAADPTPAAEFAVQVAATVVTRFGARPV
jgi:sugar/nucleoside kinase (ribokinase family)